MENIKKGNADLLSSKRVVIKGKKNNDKFYDKIKFIIFFLSCYLVGDGRKGCPEHAPFNAIHVGAAAPVLPQDVCLHSFFRIIFFIDFLISYS